MKKNDKKSMYELIMEEISQNPILTTEETQSMKPDELFHEDEFLDEITIIDEIAQKYAYEKDKTKVESLINEALAKRNVMRESNI